jgi:DNA polymerase III epsilon subunit-like protein
MKQQQKIYCSLDIETSGFDPLTNEILEVGFVFFTIGDKGVKVTEEFTQVFCPSRPVMPQILGLTGISQAELDSAPKFSEYQKVLQDKLGRAVIVGHNITFDIKFLEAFGIKFNGESIDTLDLVQWILPTHHSYNLENLMHAFAISHKEAHRALADSKATLKLLEKLLQVYCGFSDKLKNEIKNLIKPCEFLWEDFLAFNLTPLIFSEQAKEATLTEKKNIPDSGLGLEPKIIYNLPLNSGCLQWTAKAAAAKKSKTLLVLPNIAQVMQVYKQGLIEDAVFLPENIFNEKKFSALLKKENLGSEEVRFVLKIMVWRETNWQKRTVLDLNLSFFGGQFKSLITGGEITENKSAKVLACDQPTFLQLSAAGLYYGHMVVICGLSEFENSITSDIGTKAGWGYINFLLKSFYNPELDFGLPKYKNVVLQTLLGSDLFFGLVNALLHTNGQSFQYYKISPQAEYEESYQKIKTAAQSFIEKLSEANKTLASKEIEKFSKNLHNFFEKEENRVKWIELAERRCVFYSMPISITELVDGVLKPYKKVCFVDSLQDEITAKFFVNRLGLNNFVLQRLSEVAPKASKIKQGDLFSLLKKASLPRNKSIGYHLLPQAADNQALSGLIADNKSLPAVILFPSPALVRDFYDSNYQELKTRAAVLAQSNSGGSNKIFHNFSINEKSVLLATDKFILKYLSAQPAVSPVEKLRVKTLIVCRLPFEQFTHPYQEAVSQSVSNAFMDYALPKAVFNFQSILQFFYTDLLKDVYIIDVKLGKDYASVFKDFYRHIPGAKSAA